MSRFIALLLSVVSLSAIADGHDYGSVDEFVATLGPDPTRQMAEGDLNGDTLSDFAIISRIRDKNAFSKMHILLQTTKRRFRLVQESRSDEGFSNVQKMLSIKNGSLYVSLEGMNPTQAGEYQFKLYRGIWRMIGLTYSVYDPADLGPSLGAHFVETEFNLLTGDIITKRETKEGKKIARDRAFGSPCLLKDYDFDLQFCIRNWKTQQGVPVLRIMGAY